MQMKGLLRSAHCLPATWLGQRVGVTNTYEKVSQGDPTRKRKNFMTEATMSMKTLKEVT